MGGQHHSLRRRVDATHLEVATCEQDHACRGIVKARNGDVRQFHQSAGKHGPRLVPEKSGRRTIVVRYMPVNLVKTEFWNIRNDQIISWGEVDLERRPL